MKLAFAFEYLLKGHGRKDVVQVPATLAALLDRDWCFICRPSDQQGEIAGRGASLFTGRRYGAENQRRLSEDNASAVTFTTTFAILAGWKASAISDFYGTMFICGRTALSAAAYRIGRSIRGMRGFVYVKADLSYNGRKVLEGAVTSSLIGRLKLTLFSSNVDLVSVETEDGKQWLESLYPRLRGRVVVVRSCPAVRPSSGESSVHRSKRLIAVSRLGAPEKGVDILLAAARRFLKRAPDWKVTLVGSDSARLRALLREYEDLVAKGAIEYIGFVGDGAKLAKILQSAAIYVQASRWESESGSFALIEAIREGCIPLCTRVFPVDDLLGKYSAALSVPPDDVDALVAGLWELASRPEIWPEVRDYLQARTKEWNWQSQLRPVALAYTQKMRSSARSG